VRERFDDLSSPAVATELVTTSISSGGDGSDSRDDIAAVLPENPHIRYFTGRRGYIRSRITPDELRADFRVLPYVSRPGAPVRTGASFVVPDRDPALHASEPPSTSLEVGCAALEEGADTFGSVSASQHGLVPVK
jgi:alkaline phosphatase D